MPLSYTKILDLCEQSFKFRIWFFSLFLLNAGPEPLFEAIESERLDVPVDLIENERFWSGLREHWEVAHAEDARWNRPLAHLALWAGSE